MKELKINVDKFVTNLKISMLRLFPFYGHILGQLPVVVCNKSNHPEMSTMGVGKASRDELLVKLFVNSDYIEHVINLCNRDESKVIDHFTEVMKHEMHHLIFGHLNLQLKDQSRCVTACELSVNSYVNRKKLVAEPTKDGKESRGVFPENFGLEKGLGVMEYYELLKKNNKFNQKQQAGKKQKSSSQSSEQEQLVQELDKLAKRQESAANKNDQGKGSDSKSQQEQSDISNDTQQAAGKSDNSKVQDALNEAMKEQQQAQNELSKGNRGLAADHQHNAADSLREARNEVKNEMDANSSQSQSLDSHEMWGSVQGDEMASEMIKDIVRKANETCRQMGKWGDVPAEVMEAIDECYESKKQVIPWEVVLKDFLASSSENVLDYTMKRKSKRYDTRPGTKKDDVLSVAIGIDTSGSIDDSMLELFFSELRWMDKTGTKIKVFEWDTKVNRVYNFSEFDGTVSGRGGTDPTDFLQKATEEKFDCLITFTDLEFAPITEKYNVPMMWVVCNDWYNDGKLYDAAPDGIIMKVNSERDGFEVVRR